MRFEVLGPLRVCGTTGKQVRVPEAKVRALLAALLVAEGEPVSTDRLIDDLWGTRPPGKPVGALRAKVSQLRGALDTAQPGARELVEYHAPGYLLRIDRTTVDAIEFRELAGRARESAEVAERVRLLDEALGLWRGPAFAEFADAEFTRATITKLTEQRLAAVEDRAFALLAMDVSAAGELSGELTELVTAHPLRERLRAAQLRALYQAGRQSEALASYARLRTQLREELGLDPGPEITELHGAILRQDPNLGAADRQAPSSRPSRREQRDNLPIPAGELIGRAQALADLGALLGKERLVTLTGPGGVGKTRLAIEAARQPDAPDWEGPDWEGVVFVELGALDRTAGESAKAAAALVDHLAGVLGIREGQTGVTLRERLIDGLSSRRLLVLLDNCEHLVEQVAELVTELLRAGPELRVLATSQQALAVRGEHLFPVPPLDLPDSATPATGPAAFGESSAVQLFRALAEASTPGWQLTAANAADVAAICRQLDGIPLALELAATRLRVLSVQDLATRLRDRFRLLTAGHRDAPARQQTLRAMLDWSWELLSQPEQTVLRRLAAHTDGCTLAAAEAVCADEQLPAGDVLELLGRLVDRSLVTAQQAADGVRYRLLESVAVYGAEQLRGAAEADVVLDRHDQYYLALAEYADCRLRGAAQHTWLRRLDADTGNLRGALSGALHRGAADLALRLACALCWYWYLRGRFGEAYRALGEALGLSGEADPQVRRWARVWRANFALLLGEHPLELPTDYRELADPARRALAQWFLGSVGFTDPAETDELAAESLAAFRELDDDWGIALGLATMAWNALNRGDLVAAKRDAEHSMALLREIGDRWAQLQAIPVLSSLAEIAGDYAESARLHEHARRIAEEFELWPEVSYQISGLGRLALLRGDLASADELHGRAWQLATEQSDKLGQQLAQLGLGLGARRAGRLDEAEQHFRPWLGWNTDRRVAAGVALILAELGFIAEQRGEAEQALRTHLDGLTAARETGDPRAIALAWEGIAGARALAGARAESAMLLGVADGLRQSVNAPLPPAERGDVRRIEQAASAALGPPAFAAEFARGKESTPGAELAALEQRLRAEPQ
ncbi:putative ATPase [Tamaricihabitans halophyticus]|uniref:Putative ATPase n=1 Tax=Tamaricihabitans halophyticus TaxID=1262583 RepID=A0A4R2R1R7_9PSEU|nr:BTAD domain-containing putative transcriptional regulator [Tamaricihabitans halophyticus]TCP56453.1 putative ATPase [Tamaricihabitans halophyticus]